VTAAPLAHRPRGASAGWATSSSSAEAARAERYGHRQFIGGLFPKRRPPDTRCGGASQPAARLTGVPASPVASAILPVLGRQMCLTISGLACAACVTGSMWAARANAQLGHQSARRALRLCVGHIGRQPARHQQGRNAQRRCRSATPAFCQHRGEIIGGLSACSIMRSRPPSGSGSRGPEPAQNAVNPRPPP